MNKQINLGSVQETLLLPLWGRAIETQSAHPLLIDNIAVEIVNSIDYDFPVLENKINSLNRFAWVARSIYFDERIKTFLGKYPNGTIINIGCGLDTTFDRVDNDKATWYEIDFPDVIALRRRFLKKQDRRHEISSSVFDKDWYEEIKEKNNVLVLMAGLIYYFTEDQIKELFKTFQEQFQKCTVLFDFSSVKGVEIANKQLLDKAGIDSDARLRWGIDDIYALESWETPIKIVHSMTMFTQHKKKYPLKKRIGMFISDSMKVMSLASIEIGN